LETRCGIFEKEKPLQKDPNIVFFLAKFSQVASFNKTQQYGFVKMDGFEPSILP
jgi:hypothetical protein